jgi:hypothetical protein
MSELTKAHMECIDMVFAIFVDPVAAAAAPAPAGAGAGLLRLRPGDALASRQVDAIDSLVKAIPKMASMAAVDGEFIVLLKCFAWGLTRLFMTPPHKFHWQSSSKFLSLLAAMLRACQTSKDDSNNNAISVAQTHNLVEYITLHRAVHPVTPGQVRKNSKITKNIYKEDTRPKPSIEHLLAYLKSDTNSCGYDVDTIAWLTAECIRYSVPMKFKLMVAPVTARPVLRLYLDPLLILHGIGAGATGIAGKACIPNCGKDLRVTWTDGRSDKFPSSPRNPGIIRDLISLLILNGPTSASEYLMDLSKMAVHEPKYHSDTYAPHVVQSLVALMAPVVFASVSLFAANTTNPLAHALFLDVFVAAMSVEAFRQHDLFAQVMEAACKLFCELPNLPAGFKTYEVFVTNPESSSVRYFVSEVLCPELIRFCHGCVSKNFVTNTQLQSCATALLQWQEHIKSCGAFGDSISDLRGCEGCVPTLILMTSYLLSELLARDTSSSLRVSVSTDIWMSYLANDCYLQSLSFPASVSILVTFRSDTHAQTAEWLTFPIQAAVHLGQYLSSTSSENLIGIIFKYYAAQPIDVTKTYIIDALLSSVQSKPIDAAFVSHPDSISFGFMFQLMTASLTQFYCPISVHLCRKLAALIAGNVDLKLHMI